MTLQQLNNIQLEIDRNANLAQQRYANAINTNQINAGLIQQQLQNQSNNLQFGANIARQKYGNAVQNLSTKANLQQAELGNTTDDTLSPFAKISSATIVTTQKNLFYESEPGNWERDQKANAWKDSYN